MSAGSPMLKLVMEIESVLTISLAAVYFSPSFFLVLPPFSMKKDDHPLSMGRSTSYGKWVIGFRNGARLLRFNRFSFWVTKLPESSASKIS